jgi:hypothetical protein
MSPRIYSKINPDRPRIACRLLSKAGDDAQQTQASPTREHFGGLFGPDLKCNEQVQLREGVTGGNLPKFGSK